MTEFEQRLAEEREVFGLLTRDGSVGCEELERVYKDARVRAVDMERILLEEMEIPKSKLLRCLEEYYQCPSFEFDERIPVSQRLLWNVNGQDLLSSLWFPIFDGDHKVVVLTHNPMEPGLLKEVSRVLGGDACTYEFWVALKSDIRAYIQDYLHAPPDRLVGKVRTELAYWRNNMARWRTRLACYRTDLAKARTNLSLIRGGLALLALGRTLMGISVPGWPQWVYYGMISSGFLIVGLGLYVYLRINKSRFAPPRYQTLIEVTSATLHFTEDYQYVENRGAGKASKGTMLARLAESLEKITIDTEEFIDQKDRTVLVHERNLMAAKRTIAACYRTCYARARTGLAFVRTGVFFLSVGLGFIQYFGMGLITAFDLFLISSGCSLIVHGLIWYVPVRRERAEIHRTLMAA